MEGTSGTCKERIRILVDIYIYTKIHILEGLGLGVFQKRA